MFEPDEHIITAALKENPDSDDDPDNDCLVDVGKLQPVWSRCWRLQLVK